MQGGRMTVSGASRRVAAVDECTAAFDCHKSHVTPPSGAALHHQLTLKPHPKLSHRVLVGRTPGLMAAWGETQAANVDKFKQVAEWEERASFYHEEVGTNRIRLLLAPPSSCPNTAARVGVLRVGRGGGQRRNRGWLRGWARRHSLSARAPHRWRRRGNARRRRIARWWS